MATAKPASPITGTTLLVLVGEDANGALLRWQRDHKVRSFDKVISAPSAGRTPARKDYSDAEYPDVIAAHGNRERNRAKAFCSDVVGVSFDYDTLIVLLDTVAMTYDSKAKIYPTVAGGDAYCALRSVADYVIEAK